MIKAAVVGVGYLGKFHVQKYHKSKFADLIAVVDRDEARANSIAKSVKALACTNYKELPKLGIQCASIASDTTTHADIACYLLEQGIDVLVEKPIAASTEEAKRIIEAARANSRILQVGHLERFNPAFLSMKEILTRPMFFEVRRIAKFAGRGHDVDVVRDLMIHDIDIVCHLVGRPVLKVEAVGVPVITETVDIANARITFEGGAIANFTASRAALKSERSIRIFQPEVYISLDFEKKRLKICTRDNKKGKTLLGFPNIKVVEKKSRATRCFTA